MHHDTKRADANPDVNPPAAFKPYVAAGENMLEFTAKSVLPGILFGIIFGAANAYLGMQAGLTISTSIPIAVMTVAAYRALHRFGVRGTILESNMSQTIGSASSSVASGAIFTLPALFMWEMDPSLLQMTLLTLFGGMLGVLFMIPLRQFLIEREHGRLPYPEGTACAEVLAASEAGGARAKNVFLGLGVGAAIKFVFGWLKVLPGTIRIPVPFINKAEIGVSISAAMFGVGFILGPRIGAVMVGGGLLSALVIIPVIDWWGSQWTQPWFPETEKTVPAMSAHDLWDRYVRYIGAGAVATAGLMTLVRSIPTMVESFRLGMRQMRRGAGRSAEVPRTQRDLSLRVTVIGAGITAVLLAGIPQVFGTIESLPMRIAAAACVVVFAFFFVTVAARIVGLVGVTSNPTSGMTIASLLGTATAFALLGWTDQTGMAAALTVGCVVATAASISGDMSQDLKTGYLLGATPSLQQVGEILGVLTSAVFVCLTLLLLDRAYGFGTRELPAPQATLMKLVIEGVLAAKLPWMLVGIGAGISIIAALLRIPALPFAVGVYLPVSTMVPVFLGGVLRWLVGRRASSEAQRNARTDSGVLFGSGLVGGEGLFGVVIAGVVFYQTLSGGAAQRPPLPFEIGTSWGGSAMTSLAAAGVLVVLGIVFARRCWCE